MIPLRSFIGAAAGWGGLPEQEATHIGVEARLPVGECRIEVPADVPVDAFWSVSLCNRDGFYVRKAQGASSVSSVTVERYADGSMTVHLGGCEDGRVTCLPIMEGWNQTVRLCQPGLEVLDGSWSFPSAEPAS